MGASRDMTSDRETDKALFVDIRLYIAVYALVVGGIGGYVLSIKTGWVKVCALVFLGVATLGFFTIVVRHLSKRGRGRVR